MDAKELADKITELHSLAFYKGEWVILREREKIIALIEADRREQAKREGEGLPCRATRPMTEDAECTNYECPNFDPDHDQNCSSHWSSGDGTEYAVERCLEWKVPCQTVQNLRKLLNQATPASDATALKEAHKQLEAARDMLEPIPGGRPSTKSLLVHAQCAQERIDSASALLRSEPREEEPR